MERSVSNGIDFWQQVLTFAETITQRVGQQPTLVVSQQQWISIFLPLVAEVGKRVTE
jgi:hypothetical protein